jgi:RNA polymerase sigma-70 factor (ECF subfamily)
MPISDAEDSLTIEDGSDGLADAMDVNNAVMSLNSTEQEIVFLAFNARLTYREISEVMNIPVGTVKSRMSTIKSKLKKRLENGVIYND